MQKSHIFTQMLYCCFAGLQPAVEQHEYDLWVNKIEGVNQSLLDVFYLVDSQLILAQLNGFLIIELSYGFWGRSSGGRKLEILPCSSLIKWYTQCASVTLCALLLEAEIRMHDRFDSS